MHRPVSIIYFERLFWASLLLGFVSTAFAWDRMMTDVARDAAMLQTSTAITIIVVILAIMAAVSIGFWYGIARRASNVVKWIYVVWMGLGSLATLASLFDPTGFRGAALAASLLSTVLTLASIVCLFRPDAVAWLTGNGRVDPKVFD